MRKRSMLFCTFLGVTSALVVLTAQGVRAQTKNVVLIYLDDTSWIDLPYFNPPVKWSDSLNPPLGSPPYASSTEEQQLWSPDLNRVAARIFAESNGTLGYFDPDGIAFSGDEYLVSPIDKNLGGTTNADYFYNNSSVKREILAGHGGFKNLTTGGSGNARRAEFHRFYATAGKCAPTRASVYTGRNNLRTGVGNNGNTLSPSEVTIGEYMKQGCDGKDPAGNPLGERQCVDRNGQEIPCTCYLRASECKAMQCYVTGFLGKWHLGGRSEKPPWRQGFDEFFGFIGGARHYFSTSAETCSPVTQKYCAGTHVPCYTGGGGCTCQDAKTAASEKRGLYLGASTGATPCIDSASDDNPNCCRFRGATNQGTYEYSKKTSGFARDNLNSQPCHDNDNPTATTGCAYEPRFLRDLAKNFIQRHASERFFLHIAFHATHGAYAAPIRTTAHYLEEDASGNPVPKPNRPFDGARFWALIEEVDAAIGQITQQIKDSGLDDETLVLITSDQGAPHAGFGRPQFRGHKGDVFEGGIRVGLIASGPNGSVTTGKIQPTPPTSTNKGQVASAVDLFATIAETGGGPIDGAGRVGSFYVCKNSGETCCMSGEECTLNSANAYVCNPTGAGNNDSGSQRACQALSGCQSPDVCEKRYVDGVSFLPVLLDHSTPRRNKVFARYTGAGQTVVTRDRYFLEDADHCNNNSDCATYAANVCTFTAEASPNRKVLGSSCIPCTCAPGTACTSQCGVNNKTCNILGKVCVVNNATNIQNCLDGTGVCDASVIASRQRCKSNRDCASGSVCVEARTKCNVCAPAAWKLKASDNAPVALYDVSSNPEEEDKIMKDNTADTNGELNCLQPATGANSKLCEVQDELSCHVIAWGNCVTSPNSVIKNGDPCEDMPSSCPTNTCAP